MATASKLQSEIGGPILASHHDDQTNDIRNLASAVGTIQTAVPNFSVVGHTHEITSVNGLSAALASKLSASNNLSEVNPKLARANLGIEKFTAVGDANYTALATDRIVGITTAFTSAHVYTMPAANTVNSGQSIRIIDYLGTVNATNTLTIVCSGSDTLNGMASNVFNTPCLDILFTSDGNGRWAYAVVGVTRGGTGATTPAGARANLGVPAALNGVHNGTTQFDSIYAGGLTAQFPVTANFLDSTHSVSRRVTVNVGSGWQIQQDTAGVGTKDFAIYNVQTASQVININPTTNMISPGGDNLIGFGTQTNRFSAFNARAYVARDATAPIIATHNSSGATDSKIWDQTASPTTLSYRISNDALTSTTTWMTVARATMNVTTINIGGTSFAPITDNAATLGTSSNRWNTIYSSSATINTSDADEKTPFRAYSHDELDAIGEVLREGGMFKWLSAVNEKGYDAARTHCGYTAQSLRQALISRGLDADQYAAFCCDPVTRIVTKTRSIERQMTELVEVSDLEIIIENGQPIQKRIKRTEERPVYENKPVVDENGNVVLSQYEVGAPNLPLMHPVPVMQTISEDYQETEVVEGQLQYGLRYDLVTAWALAYLLRETTRIRKDMQASEKPSDV